jgi:deoxycytidylate deaminase
VFPLRSKIYSSRGDGRKYEIVYRYISENWRPFINIQVRAVITELLLGLTYDEFIVYVSLLSGKSRECIGELLREFKGKYDEAYDKVARFICLNDDEEKDEKIKLALDLYLGYLPDFCDGLKNVLKDKIDVKFYTILYQNVGDNIRSSGRPNSGDFNEVNLFVIPKRVSQLVKAIKQIYGKKGVWITIDAIRNPFEAVYFQQRYSDFFLLAINTPNEARVSHLRDVHHLSDQQIRELDDKEYPERLEGKSIYISQNIQKCIEIADIHINNPDRHLYDNNELKSQLIWYLSLMLHPGLVTPTAIERCMQLAYSVKFSSGCISRQVGAVITDENYSVKAVGWNDAPSGQTPCILRSVQELMNGGDKMVYSQYERNDGEYQSVLRSTYGSVVGSKSLKGKNLSYCFKDLQNEVDGEKNQVYTRSLHAEENAFLQISKNGGVGIFGGYLFSTASPCELCSKKAYQLGISSVVYIDPYPGISQEHILGVGEAMPHMVLYRGAIGQAYHKLYKPIMSYKDELKMLLGYTLTGSKKKNRKQLRIKQLEEENENLKKQLRKKQVED